MRQSNACTTSSIIGVFILQGGLKAVVWTDVFQSVIMLAGLVIVAITGSMQVGGLQNVWEINQKHGRINFFEYVLWQIFIYWTWIFRFIIISSRSAPFDPLACIPSHTDVETLSHFLLTASTQTLGLETRSGQSRWEGLSPCCQFGLQLSILFSDILRWRRSEKLEGQSWTTCYLVSNWCTHLYLIHNLYLYHN